MALQPINLTPPASTDTPAVLALAFRPFFLLAAIWALLSVALWLGQLNGWWSAQQLLPATLWHAHEMLFGFGALVAAGFLLTAAQNWTNVPALRGTKLALLSLCWLAARFVPLLTSELTAITLLAVLQSLWWLGVIAAFSRQLWLAKSRRNYPFIAILTVMMLLNLSFLLLAHAGMPDYAAHLSHSMILMFCLLMGIVGARVIPFFTARATATVQISTPGLDKAMLFVSLPATALFVSSGFYPPLFSPGYLMLLSAVLNLLRLGFWFTPKLLKHPLLWSLHLSYLAMALGLLLMALSLLTELLYFKDMLHLVAISAMAAMMLSMMARVSLGHTGRPLLVGNLLALSFAALLLSGVARTLAVLLAKPLLLWLLSGALWLVAFLIFIRVYLPILTSPRLDGRPG